MREDCIEFDGARLRSGGYGALRHEGKVVRAHRLAYCQAHGLQLEQIDGMTVRHKCDNPPCINPSHLELGTHTDNMRDMMKRGRGRQPKGEKNGRATLTDLQAQQIRERQDATCRELGKKFGIHHSQVSRIRSGKARAAC